MRVVIAYAVPETRKGRRLALRIRHLRRTLRDIRREKTVHLAVCDYDRWTAIARIDDEDHIVHQFQAVGAGPGLHDWSGRYDDIAAAANRGAAAGAE